MGYFSNGSEGECYESEHCSKCIHGPRAVEARGDDRHCAVWLAHLLRNYDECNNDKSILHLLIPRDKPIGNGKCLMFIEDANANQLSLFGEAA